MVTSSVKFMVEYMYAALHHDVGSAARVAVYVRLPEPVMAFMRTKMGVYVLSVHVHRNVDGCSPLGLNTALLHGAAEPSAHVNCAPDAELHATVNVTGRPAGV